MESIWPQAIASLTGALAGGGISALVAWRVFASERSQREADIRTQESSAQRARTRDGVIMSLNAIQGLFAALPRSASPNEFVFAAHRFALSLSALTLEMSPLHGGLVSGWNDAVAHRYLKMAENIRHGGGDDMAALASLLQLVQVRLENWHVGTAPTEDFGLSDQEYLAKYPESLTPSNHPDKRGP